jgi:hypothetical protein
MDFARTIAASMTLEVIADGWEDRFVSGTLSVMPSKTNSIILWLSLIAVCTLLAALSGVRAEPLPAFDRGLVERLIRAQEAQAHALDALVRATEKCRR